MSRRPFQRSPAARSRAPTVRPSVQAFGETSPGAILADLLTFDRLLTGPVIHIIYWAGLGLIALGGFAVIGGAVGLALNEPGWTSWVLAFPTLVIGLLALAIAALLWRSFCELYVALFQIAADLRALRAHAEADDESGRADHAPAAPDDPDPGSRV